MQTERSTKAGYKVFKLFTSEVQPILCKDKHFNTIRCRLLLFNKFYAKKIRRLYARFPQGCNLIQKRWKSFLYNRKTPVFLTRAFLKSEKTEGFQSQKCRFSGQSGPFPREDMAFVEEKHRFCPAKTYTLSWENTCFKLPKYHFSFRK